MVRIDQKYQYEDDFKLGSLYLNKDFDQLLPVDIENPAYFTPGRFVDFGTFGLVEFDHSDIETGDFIALDANANPIGSTTLRIEDSLGDRIGFLDTNLGDKLYDEKNIRQFGWKLNTAEKAIIAQSTKAQKQIEQMIRHDYALKMVESYLDAASRSDSDQLIEKAGLDVNTFLALSDSAIKVALKDCERFVNLLPEQALEAIEPSDMGMDFWLTRNRHGTGFWDNDSVEIEPFKEVLTELSQAFGEVNCYIDDEGKFALEDLTHLNKNYTSLIQTLIQSDAKVLYNTNRETYELMNPEMIYGKIIEISEYHIRIEDDDGKFHNIQAVGLRQSFNTGKKIKVEIFEQAESLFIENGLHTIQQNTSNQYVADQLNKRLKEWHQEGKQGTPEYDQLVNKINEVESLLKPQSKMEM